MKYLFLLLFIALISVSELAVSKKCDDYLINCGMGAFDSTDPSLQSNSEVRADTVTLMMDLKDPINSPFNVSQDAQSVLQDAYFSIGITLNPMDYTLSSSNYNELHGVKLDHGVFNTKKFDPKP